MVPPPPAYPEYTFAVTRYPSPTSPYSPPLYSLNTCSLNSGLKLRRFYRDLNNTITALVEERVRRGRKYMKRLWGGLKGGKIMGDGNLYLRNGGKFRLRSERGRGNGAPV